MRSRSALVSLDAAVGKHNVSRSQSGDGYFEAFQADLQRSEGGSSSGCGCAERKKWLNEKIPGAGDLVEKITTATGIKAAVDKWYGH